MEETETIYDLESQEKETPNPSDGNEPADQSEEIVSADADCEENSKIEEKSPAETELGDMISKLGADTLLQIIKGNRNAAIRQIITEVESSRDNHIPSGTSSAPSCMSIFDLAAMA